VIIGYGNYALTFAITSTHTNATFLTSSAFMSDGRTGVITSIAWDTGTQATSVTVTITVTITSPLDSTAAIGVVGICNVQGLPAGIPITVNGVTQALTAGARGELSAWFLPNALNSNTLTITFTNSLSGGHPILTGATFGIGEIFIGRALTVPMLTGSKYPTGGRFDLTQNNETAGGQNWALLRKTRRTRTTPLGLFTTKDVRGGSANSSIVSGGNPAGKIDLDTLIDNISTSSAIAICDTPSAGLGAGTTVNGIRFDQSFMQQNWMLCRPSNLGDAPMDQDPFWSWTPTFQESI
jgi:hypothetical protein